MNRKEEQVYYFLSNGSIESFLFEFILNVCIGSTQKSKKMFINTICSSDLCLLKIELLVKLVDKDDELLEYLKRCIYCRYYLKDRYSVKYNVLKFLHAHKKDHFCLELFQLIKCVYDSNLKRLDYEFDKYKAVKATIPVSIESSREMKTNFCGKRKLDDDNDSAQVPVFVQYSREVDEMGDKERKLFKTNNITSRNVPVDGSFDEPITLLGNFSDSESL